MNTDWAHSLNQLARILFEPVFGVMIAGIVLGLIVNARRRDRKFYVVLLGVGFMIAWRCCIHMLSKRYFEILIYAGVGLSAYGLCVFPSWVSCLCGIFLRRRCPAAVRAMRRYRRLTGRVMVFALVAACCGKMGCYNRYDDTLPRGCDAVRRDAAEAGRPAVIELCGERSRLHYYSGLPVLSVAANVPRQEQRRRLSALLKRGYDAVYVCCKEKRGERFTVVEPAPAVDGWDLIFSAPWDNRKKAYLNVYRRRGSGKK